MSLQERRWTINEPALRIKIQLSQERSGRQKNFLLGIRGDWRQYFASCFSPLSHTRIGKSGFPQRKS